MPTLTSIRLLTALLAYSACLLLIAAGFHLSPNLTWPATHTDWLAVNLIILGFIAKLIGHSLILGV